MPPRLWNNNNKQSFASTQQPSGQRKNRAPSDDFASSYSASDPKTLSSAIPASVGCNTMADSVGGFVRSVVSGAASNVAEAINIIPSCSLQFFHSFYKCIFDIYSNKALEEYARPTE